MKQTIWVWLLFCVACCSGASGQSTAGITGRDALQKMMTAANQWSPDAKAIRLSSGTCTTPPRDGFCNEWRAFVFSIAKKKTANFCWRGGVVTQSEVSDFSTQDKSSAIEVSRIAIEVSRIKVDSDAAFHVSEERTGTSILEKNPGIRIRYIMGWDNGMKKFVWIVVYESPEPRQRTQDCAIDAGTGDFIKWMDIQI